MTQGLALIFPNTKAQGSCRVAPQAWPSGQRWPDATTSSLPGHLPSVAQAREDVRPLPPRPPRTPKSSTLLTTLGTPTNGRQIPSVPFLGILTGAEQKPGMLSTPASGVSPADTHSCTSDTQLTGSLRADAHWAWQGMKEGVSWARKTWGSIQSSFLSPRTSASATYLPKPESRLRRYPLSQP